MSRADGLVQRRNVSHSQAGDPEGARGRGSDDEESRRSDEDDIDSKETRFTLMEEVLLLGLKDEQVTAAKTCTSADSELAVTGHFSDSPFTKI